VRDSVHAVIVNRFAAVVFPEVPGSFGWSTHKQQNSTQVCLSSVDSRRCVS